MSKLEWHLVWGPPGRAGARPQFSEILPELLVGEYLIPADVTWLRTECGVTAVLNLQDDPDLSAKGLHLPALETAYAEAGMHFERVKIADGDKEMLLAQLDRAVAIVDAALAGGHRLYVHCNAGMNRAPTVAIAYLHAHRGLTLAEARDFLKKKRHCVPYMSVLETRYGTPTP